jgi:hypothetical protein
MNESNEDSLENEPLPSNDDFKLDSISNQGDITNSCLEQFTLSSSFNKIPNSSSSFSVLSFSSSDSNDNILSQHLKFQV